MNSKILIVIPTYYEYRNISILFPLILQNCPKVTLLCIDDYSSDGSQGFMQDLQKSQSNFKVITRNSKSGVASAFILGMRYGYKNSFDWVICMDADLSHRFEDLLTMIKYLSYRDPKSHLIIGSRYVSGGRVNDVPIFRQIISKLGNFLGRRAIGCNTRDVTSGFRGYSSLALLEVLKTPISTGGYGFQLQIFNQIFKANLAIREMPITYVARKNGKSKLSLKIILETFWICITIFTRRLR